MFQTQGWMLKGEERASVQGLGDRDGPVDTVLEKNEDVLSDKDDPIKSRPVEVGI